MQSVCIYFEGNKVTENNAIERIRVIQFTFTENEGILTFTVVIIKTLTKSLAQYLSWRK